MIMDYMTEYSRWKNQDKIPEDLRSELDEICDDTAAIKDRFGLELEFGTAGLRGILGAGTNRMNIYVVRRATAALCKALLEDSDTRGVAIAYDSRIMSTEFAKEAASVLIAAGIRVYMYSTLHPVPQLSYAIRHHCCAAGIVITASHNPKVYNGYKVYGADGGQIEPEKCERIQQYIADIDMFAVETADLFCALDSGLLRIIGEETDDAYYEDTLSLRRHTELSALQLSQSIVYTPLHGSGNVPVNEILTRAGFCNVYTVAEQKMPDGTFPTVDVPNPENDEAYVLAKRLANMVHANLIIATDPDSDRVGVCVRNKKGIFCKLTGNEIGCILLYYLLTSMAENGGIPKHTRVAKSIVSTPLADRICADFSVRIDNTLTGFRYISAIAEECAQSENDEFLFGFEESYGFLAGSFARDKDAICASMLICEAHAFYLTHGMTLLDVLDEIFARYGEQKDVSKSFDIANRGGMDAVAKLMQKLRDEEKCDFCGQRLMCFEDYKCGESIDIIKGGKKQLTLPSTNMLRYVYDGAYVCVRPSGTEPKLKLYVGAMGTADASAASVCDVLCDGFMAKINDML